MDALRASNIFVAEASIVAELDGDVVGHILLSGVELGGDTKARALSLPDGSASGASARGNR